MARFKRASDEVYNARRRAKRLLARMEREDTSGMSVVERRARADYMESVRAQIEQSYQGTRKARDVESAKERAQGARKKLDRMTRTPRKVKGAKERSDVLFQRQVNLARIGAPSLFGEHGDAAVSVFYASTRKFWRGRDPKERNRLIMEALGVNTLEAAFDVVLIKNMQAVNDYIESAVTSSTVDGRTDENADFYDEVGVDPELTGSARWAVKTFTFGD